MCRLRCFPLDSGLEGNRHQRFHTADKQKFRRTDLHTHNRLQVSPGQIYTRCHYRTLSIRLVHPHKFHYRVLPILDMEQDCRLHTMSIHPEQNCCSGPALAQKQSLELFQSSVEALVQVLVQMLIRELVLASVLVLVRELAQGLVRGSALVSIRASAQVSVRKLVLVLNLVLAPVSVRELVRKLVLMSVLVSVLVSVRELVLVSVRELVPALAPASVLVSVQVSAPGDLHHD